MMNISALIKEFYACKERFETGIREVDRNLDLKCTHTLMVRDEARALAAAEKFSPDESFLLECAAILHDISRFEQFSRYRTFSDARSFDHGERSFELVQTLDLLEALPEKEQNMILAAVRYHNRAEIPRSLSPGEEKLLRAVRDADKIDIMRVLLEHLEDPVNPDVVFHLDTALTLTPEVEADILAGKPPLHSSLKTGLDFTAAKFAWAFDLNYAWTAKQFLERKYFVKLRSFLPPEPHSLNLMLSTALQALGSRRGWV